MSTISYIIPVYRAAAYIETSTVSLLCQTYPDIEYIFVDDCSPDSSVEILMQIVDRFPQRKRHVKVIRMPRNSGSATARNAGLDTAMGKYVMFADSDDWVEANYVEDMVAKIEGERTDIVYCDYFETYKEENQYNCQDHGTDALNCIAAMLTGCMHGSTCNKIYRRSFLIDSHQRFVDGADLFEDVGWNIRLFALAGRISYLNKAYYHYVQYNEDSIIKSMQSSAMSRQRALQRICNVDVTCKFLDEHGMLSDKLLMATNEWKLLAKNDLLENNSYSLCRWIVTFPESDAAIWKSDSLSLNLKLLLTWLHCRCLWLYKFQKWITKQFKR